MTYEESWFWITIEHEQEWLSAGLRGEQGRNNRFTLRKQ
jgi:hypothetical protein